MKTQMTVLIADAQPLFAESLAISLRNYPDMAVLAELPTSATETEAAATIFRPDIVLLDLWLDADASALIRELSAPDKTKVIVLSGLHGPNHIRAAIAAGAAGFLPRGLTVPYVHEAIRRAHDGARPVFADELKALLGRIEERQEYLLESGHKASKLTPRELEILRLIAAGLALEEITSLLSLRPRTVRNHIQNMLEKMGVQTQMRAIAKARDLGLLEHPTVPMTTTVTGSTPPPRP